MAHVHTGRTLPRRTFLRGVGSAFALPLLDAMVPAFAGEPSAAVRMAFIYAPNGKDMGFWTPVAKGVDYELPSLLKPLAGLKSDFSVLTGLTLDGGRAHGDGPGDHARAVGSFLTAAHPRKTAGVDIRAGISVDQVAARKVGRTTRFASLELGCEAGRSAGSCDSGYSCAYTNNVSWRSPTTPNAKEIDPRLVFARLFGGGNPETDEERKLRLSRRRSALDFALEDAKRLRGTLGPTDRRKVDEYLEGVREVERRIQMAESGGAADRPAMEFPDGVPRQYVEHIRLLHDLIVLAFQTDQTRIVTFMYGNAGSNRSYGFLGVPGGHHQLSHHGGDVVKKEQIRKINLFHVQQFAHLLGRLKAVPDGDGTLLDSVMVLYGSGISDGNRHNHDRLPILLAGHGGGTLTPGKHVRYPAETPLANLYVSLLDRMNVRVASFGDSTGRLEGI